MVKRKSFHGKSSAISLIVFSALEAASAQGQNRHPTGHATLFVNDPNAIGSVGDSLLSLDEAIRLSNGSLALNALSPAERRQVKNEPGPYSNDRIELAFGATLTMPKGASLSRLVGNDGDTIDGNGATLLAAAPGKGVGLIVSSSNFTLTNFQARNFETAVRVDFGGRNLKNVALTRLHLIGTDGALLTAAALSSNGSLTGLSITDSQFEFTGSKGNLLFIGSAAPVQGSAPIANTLLENVVFARNQLKGGAIGMYIHGSLSGVDTTNATTRHVKVLDNNFSGQSDSPINVAGALPAVGATHSNVTLEDVLVARNHLEAANWGIWMGHETFGFGIAPTFAKQSRWRNISVSNNVITMGSHGGGAQCIALETAADSPGDKATGNIIENVKITGNDIRGCTNATTGLGAGVIVYAGRNLYFGSQDISRSTGNSLTNLEISGNRIANSDRGIVIGGGYSLRIPTTMTSAGKNIAAGAVSNNSLSGFKIVGNELSNDKTGIRIVGGEGPVGSTVTQNSITGVIGANHIMGSATNCEVIANVGAATGNSIQASCPKLSG